MRTRCVCIQSSRTCTASATWRSSSSNMRPTWWRVRREVPASPARLPTARPPTSHHTSVLRINLTVNEKPSRQARDAVANAAHVANQLRRELAAQVVHVDLDRVRADFLAPSIHRVLESLARHDRAGLLQQRFQHRKFARRKFPLASLEEHPPARRVEYERAITELALAAAAVAADDRARAGEQLVEVEGLHQVIVGAAVQAGDAIGDRVARGDDENGQIVLGAAHALQHLQAVLPG